MKILVLGHKGYLGSFLQERLDADCLETRNLYRKGEYDYVINCIGVVGLEYCETHKEESDYANRDIMIDIQRLYPESKIINFSSYYVYDSKGLCTEESQVTDRYNYCRQKLECEQLVRKGVSFRLGKLFGNPRGEKKLTEYIIKNDNIVLDMVRFNPTSLEQVYRVVNLEINSNILNGVYNLANDGITSQYDYGVFINKILGADKNIIKVKKMNRCFHNYGMFTMSLEKIKKYVSLVDWRVDMVRYLIK